MLVAVRTVISIVGFESCGASASISHVIIIDATIADHRSGQ